MSPRDLRALTVGVGAIAVAILAFRVLPRAIHSTIAERDRLRASRTLLEQAMRELSGAPRFEDSAAVIRKALDSLAPKILSGGTDAEAWSDLESRLSLAASRNRAAFRGSTRLPDSVRAGLLRRISGRAQLESDLRGVLAVLLAIEHNSVALQVSEVRLEAVNPDSPSSTPEILRAEFVVAGWFLSGGKRSAER